MDTATRYLTPPTIAETLGVGVMKVLGWIDAGELRAINVATSREGRPRWAIDPEEFERFKTARSSKPATPRPIRRRRQTAGVKEYF